jgi:hypothetical protein
MTREANLFHAIPRLELLGGKSTASIVDCSPRPNAFGPGGEMPQQYRRRASALCRHFHLCVLPDLEQALCGKKSQIPFLAN